MKKMIAALLCSLMLFTCAASAENMPFQPFPTPSVVQPEASAPAVETPLLGGSAELMIMGETLNLDFDVDPEFSYLSGGMIQACFYKELPNGMLYELYLIFPQDVQAGSEVTSQSSIQRSEDEPGVMVYAASYASEIYAYAFQYGGAVDPVGSSYTIFFDTVSSSGSLHSFSGSVDATLVVTDDNDNPLYPIEGVSASFDFTMNFDAVDSPASPSIPSDPEISYAPSFPSASLPPDARKI